MRRSFDSIENKYARRLALLLCYPFMVLLLPPVAVIEGTVRGVMDSFRFAKEITQAVREMW